MGWTPSKRIITEQILNKATGELESVDFKEEFKRKRIRGGFSMVYTAYDEALLNCVKSNLDFQLITSIRSKFTYARIEVVLSPTALAKELSTSKQKVTKLLKGLIENKFLLRVAKGTYRLNPYMYVPYHSNGEELQREWDILIQK